MDKEKIFSSVKSHLLLQGGKSERRISATVRNQPAYRSDVGNDFKCAIGCLLPDELYDPDFEGTNIRHLLEQHEPLQNYFELSDCLDTRREEINFLNALQQVHDSRDPSEWEECLLFVHERYIEKKMFHEISGSPPF